MERKQPRNIQVFKQNSFHSYKFTKHKNFSIPTKHKRKSPSGK